MPLNEEDLYFKVEALNKKGGKKISWIFPGAGLADFLHWANSWDARYCVRPWTGKLPRGITKPVVELIPNVDSDIAGEYRHGLLFSLGELYPFRLFEGGNHYLTQHGLDGLPARVIMALHHPEIRKQPRFRVTGSDFVFEMTFQDWNDYFISGRNEMDLAQLGIHKK